MNGRTFFDLELLFIVLGLLGRRERILFLLIGKPSKKENTMPAKKRDTLLEDAFWLASNPQPTKNCALKMENLVIEMQNKLFMWPYFRYFVLRL